MTRQHAPRPRRRRKFTLAPQLVIVLLIIALTFSISGIWHFVTIERNVSPPIVIDEKLLSGPIIVPTVGNETIPVIPPAPITLEAPVHPTQDDPDSGRVGDSYFDDAVFVGDSITTGISIYGTMGNAEVFAKTGLGLHNIMTLECIPIDGAEDVTILEGLEIKQPKKIYVLLGGNSLGSTIEDTLEAYTTFVNAISAQHPDSLLYIQSVLPIHVEKYKAAYGNSLSNEKIDEFNAVLKEMCEEYGYIYLDLASVFKDETGGMPSDYTPDGIHIKPAQYTQWFDYLKYNTVED